MKHKDYPEDSELVICTVTKVYPHCVFANLEEYHNKQGMIHISEISPGRIRNINDYVKVGKKIICKVLSVNLQKGHIDLSLRRVSEGQRREKAESIKRDQKVRKIIEFVAGQTKIDKTRLHDDIEKQIESQYDSMHDFFEDYVADESIMKIIKLPAKVKEVLCETIKQRIKPPVVDIEGEISLRTFASDGADVVKSMLVTADKIDEHVTIRYKGAGKYLAHITHDNYKDAEAIMDKVSSSIETSAKKKNVEFAFERVEKKGKKA